MHFSCSHTRCALGSTNLTQPTVNVQLKFKLVWRINADCICQTLFMLLDLDVRVLRKPRSCGKDQEHEAHATRKLAWCTVHGSSTDLAQLAQAAAPEGQVCAIG